MDGSLDRAGQASESGAPGMFGAELLTDPYPMYEQLHAAGPVVHLPGMFGLGAWLVSSHAIAQSVLRSRQFGSDAHRVLPPEKIARIPQEAADIGGRRLHTLLFRDPPDHTRLRRLVSQAFTPRTVERLHGHVAEIAASLIDRVIDRGRMDLIADFAFPLPIIVIAELLGVPAADRDMLRAWSADLTQGVNPGASLEALERVERSVDRFDAYIGAIIEERRREPRSDLISDLLHAQETGDHLSMEEMLATCRLILSAGHETTVNLIGNGTLALLRHPEQRAALAQDPSLLPGAVEELLRYDSPVQLTLRFALEPTVLGGQAVSRGDLVIVLVGAANHDPEVFSAPARLDLRRENARDHLSFGAGAHYCLGAALARLEGQIAIGALLRRLPRLALASEALAWRPNPVLRGVESLPVLF
jgi:pimeloyl-[acyl-carrier protein] synthase